MRGRLCRVYRGVIILRNKSPGSKLRWSAYVDGRFAAADTLSEIKTAIRVTLDK